jgi:hypothetical protein
MTIEEDWNNIITDPLWEKASPQNRAKATRMFLQQAKRAYGIKGKDEVTRRIIAEGMPAPTESVASRAFQGGKAGLKAGTVGTIGSATGLIQQELPSLLEAAQEITRGRTAIPSTGPTAEESRLAAMGAPIRTKPLTAEELKFAAMGAPIQGAMRPVAGSEVPYIAPDIPYFVGATAMQLPELAAETALGIKAATTAARLTKGLSPLAQGAAQVGAGALSGAAIPATATGVGYAAAPQQRKQAVLETGLMATGLGAAAGGVGGLMTARQLPGQVDLATGKKPTGLTDRPSQIPQFDLMPPRAQAAAQQPPAPPIQQTIDGYPIQQGGVTATGRMKLRESLKNKLDAEMQKPAKDKDPKRIAMLNEQIRYNEQILSQAAESRALTVIPGQRARGTEERLSALNALRTRLEAELLKLESIPYQSLTPEEDALADEIARRLSNIDRQIVNIRLEPGRVSVPGVGGRPGMPMTPGSAQTQSPLSSAQEYFEQVGTPGSYIYGPSQSIAERQIAAVTRQEAMDAAQAAMREGEPLLLNPPSVNPPPNRAMYEQVGLPPASQPRPGLMTPPMAQPARQLAQPPAPIAPVAAESVSQSTIPVTPQVAPAGMMAPPAAAAPAPTRAARTPEEALAAAERNVRSATAKLQKAITENGVGSEQYNNALKSLQNASTKLDRLKKKAPVETEAPTPPSTLQRLISEESGEATPEGAFQVFAAPIIAAKMAAKKVKGGFASAPRIFRDAIASPVESAAKGVQLLGDAESAVIDTALGKWGGMTVRGIGNLTVDALDTAINTLSFGRLPKTLRRRLDSAINSLPGKNYREKTLAFFDIIKHNPANTGIRAVDSFLDWPRQVFVTAFGTTPEARAVMQAAKAAARLRTTPLEDWLQRIISSRTDDQMVQLYRDIENRNYAGNDPDVLEIKRLISAAELRLKDLGVITQEQFDRWNDTYLPRDYAKFLWLDPEASSIAAFLFKVTNDNKLKGWYGRGLRQQMDVNEAMVDIANGVDWKLTSKPTPDGKVWVWRDWTKDERSKWGEVEHAGRQVLRYAYEAQELLRKGELLDGLAKGQDARGKWALPESEVFTPVDGAKRPPEYIDSKTGEKYVFLEGKEDKGINSLGNLAGKYVRDDIASLALTNANVYEGLGSSWINKLAGAAQSAADVMKNRLWKRIMTTGNFPGYLLNNVLFGPTMLVQAGGSLADVPMAMYKMNTNHADIQRLEQLGVIRDGQKLRELSIQLDAVVRRLSNDLPDQGLFTAQNWSRFMDATYAAIMSPKEAPAIMAAAAKNSAVFTTKRIKNFANQIEKYAVATDDMYRVALVEGLVRRQGIPFEEAAETARKVFYNAQNINSAGAKILELPQPFVKVGIHTIDQFPEQIAANPHRALYLVGLGSLIPYGAAAMQPSKGETIAERIKTYESEKKLLPKRMRGLISYGVPSAIPWGVSETGRPKYIDLSNISVSSQFEPLEGAPIIPRMFSPGGLPGALGQLAFNRDLFSGRAIRGEAGPLGEPVYDYTADFLKRQFVPPTISRASDTAKQSELFPEYVPLLGGTGTRVGRFDLGTQQIRNLGLKIEDIDVEKNARIALNEYGNQAKLEMQEINQLRRNLTRVDPDNNPRKAANIQAEIQMRIGRVRSLRQAQGELAQQLQQALQKSATNQAQSMIPEVSEVVSPPEFGARMR